MQNFLTYLGWIMAGLTAVCWWIDHRGIAGIKSDLSDARSEAARLRQKVSK